MDISLLCGPVSSGDSTAYQYVSLDHEDEIRVLRLYAGSFGDPLKGTFSSLRLSCPSCLSKQWSPQLCSRCADSIFQQHADPLSSAEARRRLRPAEFEAISYAWGSPVRPRKIYIDGAPLAITNSLHDALQHLRRSYGDRRLWADAICINQSDNTELSTQVNHMADIYRAASRVLVWLGCGEPDDSIACSVAWACWEWRHVIDDRTRGWSASRPSALHELSQLMGRREPNSALSGLIAITRWTRLPWFQRLWVVQESAKELVKGVLFCKGHFVLGKDVLARALEVARESTLTQHVELASSSLWYYLFVMPKAPSRCGVSIMHRLLEQSERVCSDPRDRIFALRRLLKIEDIESLRADYDISYSELCTKFVNVCLHRHGPGDAYHIHPAFIIALKGTETAALSDQEVPSWVSNIDKFSRASQLKSFLYNELCLRVEKDVWTFLYDLFTFDLKGSTSTVLRIRGKCFAEACEQANICPVPDVSRARPSSSSSVIQPIHVRAYLDWYITCRSFVVAAMPELLASPREEALLSFLGYPTAWHVEAESTSTTGLLPQMLWDGLVRATDGWLSHSEGLFRSTYALVAELPKCPLAAKRRLWRLQLAGRMCVGWLPELTRAGDEICLLVGAPWPFVVRKTANGHFKLVGDAHVFDLSHTEAFCGCPRQAWRRWVADFEVGATYSPGIDYSGLDRNMLASLDYITLC